jgi:hypothetical protein
LSCEAHQRQKLERVCRYVARPAIANDRLKVTDCGQVVLKLKTAFRDGTTHVVRSPLEFLQRLAALVPRPRLNLIRFHGVLAPTDKWRLQVVPGKSSVPEARDDNVGEAEELVEDPGKGASGRYISWARLLKRVFDIDIETCEHCGGPLKMIAAIEGPPVSRKILIHLGLSPQPPPRSPARYDPYSDADIY